MYNKGASAPFLFTGDVCQKQFNGLKYQANL